MRAKVSPALALCYLVIPSAAEESAFRLQLLKTQPPFSPDSIFSYPRQESTGSRGYFGKQESVSAN
jgi:hypothetical protein